MERGNVKIRTPERFKGNHVIATEKLEGAIKRAAEKLESKLDLYCEGFPKRGTRRYELGENNDWTHGMHTGTLILAYQLTGKQKFLNAAIKHISTYKKRLDEKVTLESHDVGFVFSPSLISLYKLTGSDEIRNIILEVAKYFYDLAYSQKGGFILRLPKHLPKPGACRTMMDTLMNISIFFWAGEQTGEKKYIDAAKSQLAITEKYLIREDGSSYHHYQFDVDTYGPVRGLTLQGNRDESTWSRGQAWGVYGFAMGYDYTGDEKLLAVQNDTVAYTLNNLPDDCIPYWDYDFTNGSEEPRDTSAAMITVCGLLEVIKYMPKESAEVEIYKNAAYMIAEAVIDKYTQAVDDHGNEYDGLLWGVTGAKTFNMIIEGCAPYGDYFYLEALLRLTDPNWKRLW